MTVDPTSAAISLKLMNIINAKRKEAKLMSTYPLVGMFHRPPALAITGALPIGTPLLLVAEPENPYDTNAVAVWLYSKDIPEGNVAERLRETLPAYGIDLETLLSQEVWQLGYIAKNFAKELREKEIVPIDNPIVGSFSLSSGGAPRVRLTDG